MWLFIVNTTERAATPRIAIAANVGETFASSLATDIVGGEVVPLSDGCLANFSVPPKRVRAFAISKERT